MSVKSSSSVNRYLTVTACYWLFTVTDGALRMLVVLHFHNLGFNALQIALLFLFYEFFGVLTNLFGGYIGARVGLNRLMNAGMVLQIIALSMLTVPDAMLGVVWVMAAQALSGIAKDLNKMSAKSAVKTLLPAGEKARLFKWVALLTGSKNTLKGAGFFVGAFLLYQTGFRTAVLVLIALIGLALIASVTLLKTDGKKAGSKLKFTSVFSRSESINRLSAARFFLFAARDVWFVVGLPVYLATSLAWSHWKIGAFMAVWIILYGIVQSIAPRIVLLSSGAEVNGRVATVWVLILFVVTCLLTVMVGADVPATTGLLPGLFIFGAVFAVNSSLHSYLIVHYADREAAVVDVGFYYMANAAGRLAGTVLSGWLYLNGSLVWCLAGACALLSGSVLTSFRLQSGSQAAG